jgi:hypothetical protein
MIKSVSYDDMLVGTPFICNSSPDGWDLWRKGDWPAFVRRFVEREPSCTT